MGRRRYYSRKGFGKEIYAGLILGILVLIKEILMYIEENPTIVLTGAALIVVGILLKIYIDNQQKIKEKQRKQEYLRSCNSINNLLAKFKDKPIDFESYVANIFDCLGYRTEVTKASGDCGKDIIMYKNNKKYVVEVKLYKVTSKIGRDKVQKLHSALIDTNADKAVFVTTSEFTKEASEFAHKHGIVLIKGHDLVRLIEKAVSEDEFAELSNGFKPTFIIDELFE